jgi:peptide chain release factor
MSDTVHLVITSGDGPEECRIAADRLATRLTRLAKEAKLTAHRMDGVRSGNGLPRSVILSLTGDEASSFCRPYEGTVRYVFESPVRKGHKRKNWFVGVYRVEAGVFHEAQVSVNLADIRFETLRAGGPGGQHQNTTDSAVRAIHVPTGLATVAREERSQHRNKALAIQRIDAMLGFLADERRSEAKRGLFQSHHSLERGNEVMVIVD